MMTDWTAAIEREANELLLTWRGKRVSASTRELLLYRLVGMVSLGLRPDLEVDRGRALVQIGAMAVDWLRELEREAKKEGSDASGS